MASARDRWTAERIELRHLPEEATFRTLEAGLLSIVEGAAIYASTPYRDRERVGILLDFQAEPFERERLEKLLVDLGRMPLSGLIRSVRLR